MNHITAAKKTLGIVAVATLLISGTAFAQSYGTNTSANDGSENYGSRSYGPDWFMRKNSMLYTNGERFTARLDGGQEVPGVSTNGFGEGHFRWIGDDLWYDIHVEQLSSGLTAAHFHHGAAGVSGPVIEPINFNGGYATGTWADLTDQERQWLENGEIYVNFHTGRYPDGEIRGQVDMRDDDLGLPNTGTADTDVETMIADWPEASERAAMAMMDKYGEPDEYTQSMLIWHDVGPWEHVKVFREETAHSFPMPHTDVVEQTIHYNVPVEKFDELAAYDGSVVAKRTEGELAAKCDNEAMNFLALNLAHDIITNQRSVEDARNFYAQTAKNYKNGQTSDYTTGLRFSPADTGGDADTQTIW